MNYFISYVQFKHDWQLPTGSFGRSLAASESIKISRIGDTIAIESHIPENESRGFEVDDVVHLPWESVALARPILESVKKGK